MHFHTMQEAVVEGAMRYGEKYGIEIDREFAVMKLYEEVGEFSQALLIHQKKSRPEKYLTADVSKREVAKELADVVGLAMLNAHLLGIDLEEALAKKWITREWIKESKH